ncbi:hypothetical protein GHT06_014649 [Daphnia sinensis]|uniref:Uncharacterized protein n=1 Tax=Daphnia sinensis TaxID=1820382 RepID=A0AAD5PSK7_9CRUS|nr:hypothetical protein GHT06_014649 [Daphnia sinensis]
MNPEEVLPRATEDEAAGARGRPDNVTGGSRHRCPTDQITNGQSSDGREKQTGT